MFIKIKVTFRVIFSTNIQENNLKRNKRSINMALYLNDLGYEEAKDLILFQIFQIL